MGERLIIWGVFVLVVLACCYIRPNATRIFLGGFFIVMAIGFHIVSVLLDPRTYDGFATTALIPAYRWVFRNLVSVQPLLFAVLAATTEIGIALLMLNKRRAATIGLVLGSLLLLAITPLGVETLPNALLAGGLAYLATKMFDRSVWDMVWRQRHRQAPSLEL